MFNSYYDVGGQRFANIFQAFDKTIENGHFCYYKTDSDWIDQIQSIKVESDVNHLHLKEIYTKKLKELRQQHNKLVLCYTGGTDSHTILDIAIKNKIYIDEVFMSFPGIFEAESEKILNKEYNLALEFVKKMYHTMLVKLRFINGPMKTMIILIVKSGGKIQKSIKLIKLNSNLVGQYTPQIIIKT